MSTAHNGDYCPNSDKMVMTREQASRAAGRLGNSTYKCEHCNGWHIATRRNKKRLRLPR